MELNIRLFILKSCDKKCTLQIKENVDIISQINDMTFVLSQN